mmetsp:Transcript_86976/g.156670  ORF Transcript_86976/g.156670 Transcript_86976/m.156670 type:complete len:241 (-) Transcript_86976:470-1192(-)
MVLLNLEVLLVFLWLRVLHRAIQSIVCRHQVTKDHHCGAQVVPNDWIQWINLGSSCESLDGALVVLEPEVCKAQSIQQVRGAPIRAVHCHVLIEQWGPLPVLLRANQSEAAVCQETQAMPFHFSGHGEVAPKLRLLIQEFHGTRKVPLCLPAVGDRQPGKSVLPEPSRCVRGVGWSSSSCCHHGHANQMSWLFIWLLGPPHDAENCGDGQNEQCQNQWKEQSARTFTGDCWVTKFLLLGR